LFNRRYFNERLIEEVDRSKRYDQAMSIILIDIDHFKNVNDTHGHPVGDKVLVWLSSMLREKFRQTDVVARYGGEEFSVLLLNATKQQAYTLANEVRSFIENNSGNGTNGIKITCSFGISTFGEDSYTCDGLMAKADKALYFAKAQGRNKVCQYNSET